MSSFTVNLQPPSNGFGEQRLRIGLNVSGYANAVYSDVLVVDLFSSGAETATRGTIVNAVTELMTKVCDMGALIVLAHAAAL